MLLIERFQTPTTASTGGKKQNTENEIPFNYLCSLWSEMFKNVLGLNNNPSPMTEQDHVLSISQALYRLTFTGWRRNLFYNCSRETWGFGVCYILTHSWIYTDQCVFRYMDKSLFIFLDREGYQSKYYILLLLIHRSMYAHTYICTYVHTYSYIQRQTPPPFLQIQMSTHLFLSNGRNEEDCTICPMCLDHCTMRNVSFFAIILWCYNRG